LTSWGTRAVCPSFPSQGSASLSHLRSGNERTFGVKKTTFNLQGARHRKKSFWLIRLHLMATLQHAKPWIAAASAADLLDDLTGPVAAAKNAV